MQTKPSITAHMIVKNDDCWVWFAIQSTIDYVDRFLITDSGSSDQTLSIIQSIKNPKIELNQIKANTPAQVVALRKKHLAQTKTRWLWMIDADEIYPNKTSAEILSLIANKPNLAGVLVRRFDMLGDMHHFQPDERVGGYTIFGRIAHYSPRLIRTSIPGLTLAGEYPNEGFYDKNGQALLDYDANLFGITQNRYLHATYLKRSSLGATLQSTFHRDKFKQEWGKKLLQSNLPEVFYAKRPREVSDPLVHRSAAYALSSALVTPAKMLKRRFL
jgi:hypothetical protein